MSQWARLKARIEQQRRLQKLEPRCPCGEKSWPCDCPIFYGCVARYDEASPTNQFAHLLPLGPVLFDQHEEQTQ